MQKKIEIRFIDHCDESCGLGTANFECPSCGKWNTDYGDVWYGFSEYTEDVVETTCEHCKIKLKLIRTKEYGEFIVEF
jgi:hypothetical protein